MSPSSPAHRIRFPRTTRSGARAVRTGILGLLVLLVAACGSATNPDGGAAAASNPDIAASGATTATPDSSASSVPTSPDQGAPTSMPTDPRTALAAKEATWPPRLDLAAFDVDATQPLEVTELSRTTNDGVTIRELTYTSAAEGVVPALLAEPQDPTAHGMVMVPGSPERKEAYISAISEFACAGLTTIVVDPPWAREDGRSGEEAVAFTAQDRDEQVQLIRDVRRAVDLLEQDYDVDRVGYTAISYGAVMGLQVAAVEPRIDAFALLSVDGGLVDHFTYNGHPIGILAMAPRQEQEAWIEALAPVEPVRFVSEATAPILFLQGREDNVTPPQKAEIVHVAAADVADVRWYDAGHDLEPQAFRDMFTWWAEQFDLDRERVANCPAGE